MTSAPDNLEASSLPSPLADLEYIFNLIGWHFRAIDEINYELVDDGGERRGMLLDPTRVAGLVLQPVGQVGALYVDAGAVTFHFDENATRLDMLVASDLMVGGFIRYQVNELEQIETVCDLIAPSVSEIIAAQPGDPICARHKYAIDALADNHKLAVKTLSELFSNPALPEALRLELGEVLPKLRKSRL